jgi:hypothetical protein
MLSRPYLSMFVFLAFLGACAQDEDPADPGTSQARCCACACDESFDTCGDAVIAAGDGETCADACIDHCAGEGSCNVDDTELCPANDDPGSVSTTCERMCAHLYGECSLGFDQIDEHGCRTMCEEERLPREITGCLDGVVCDPVHVQACLDIGPKPRPDQQAPLDQ